MRSTIGTKFLRTTIKATYRCKMCAQYKAQKEKTTLV